MEKENKNLLDNSLIKIQGKNFSRLAYRPEKRLKYANTNLLGDRSIDIILGYFEISIFFLCNLPFPDSLFSPQGDAEHNGSPHDGQSNTDFSFIRRRHSRQTGTGL